MGGVGDVRDARVTSKMSVKSTLKWRKWAERVPSIDLWTIGRPLRVATDCSGLGCAEVSLQTIAAVHGGSVHHVFSCDVWSGSQRRLQSIGMEAILKDMNMRVWNEGTLTTKDLEGKVRIYGRSDNLDIYVCGFMCTPFTPNGQRKEWADEHAKTFFSAIKTIASLRPRVAILENVIAISNNSNSKVVKRALGNLRDYVVLYLKVNAADFGVPHHRLRIYMVGFRKDALKDIFADKPQALLEKFLQRKVDQCGQPCEIDFVDWLAVMGYPVVKSLRSTTTMAEEESEEESEQPTCNCNGPTAICELHPCKCPKCGKFGEKARRCVWRRTHRLHMKSVKFVLKRRAHLAAWRKVKNDKTLKQTPKYFAMVKSLGMDSEVVCQRGRRDLLDICAQEGSIMSKVCILNLSKSLGRTQLRKDGLVPTMGHGCLGLFLPGFATYLSIEQLMCLTGFDPRLHKGVFKIIKDQKESDMELLVGNAMSVPVIGIISGCALSMLK